MERIFIKSAGKPPEMTEKHFQKIINGHLDIKLGQFTEEELDAVLVKITT